jgi:uncharacterized repeat protein (TIGR02543 family)
VEEGKTLTDLPTPEREGYTFDGWFDAEGNKFTTETVVTGDITVTAKWTEIETYTVTVTAEGEGCTVAGAPEAPVEVGTKVTVTATAAEGYTFIGWFAGENMVSDKAEYAFTVEADTALTAKFEKKAIDPKPEYTVPECDKDDNCTLSKFHDVEIDIWYHDGIHFCVEQKIMTGKGQGVFAPNEKTTRAELVMMLYRLAKTPSVEGKTEPFDDVVETDWFYDAIIWAYENKVVSGVKDNEFAPNKSISREQVATILHRYLGKPEGSGKLEEFPDVADVSSYAVDPLAWAVGEGLITGSKQPDGTVLLDPTGNATRAQIATILMRHLTK